KLLIWKIVVSISYVIILNNGYSFNGFSANSHPLAIRFMANLSLYRRFPFSEFTVSARFPYKYVSLLTMVTGKRYICNSYINYEILSEIRYMLFIFRYTTL